MFRRRSRRGRSVLPNYLVLTVVMVGMLGPLLIVVFSAFKTPADISLNPLGPPTSLDPQNFLRAWETGNYATLMRNSLVVSFSVAVVVSVVSGMAAYALARFRLRGSTVFVVALLIMSTLPLQVFLVPLFALWAALGLTNTLQGVTIIYIALAVPFSTFFLRSFMVNLPIEYEEAARVDGASRLQVLRFVIAPILAPAFLTVALLAALGAWNEFLFAITFNTDPGSRTVATGLFAFQSRFGRDWGATDAAAIITFLPPLMLFLLLQRRFIDGLTSGGVKG